MHPLAVRPPSVDLDDTRDLLQSAQRQFPLVNIETELAPPGSCYIGRISALDEEGVVLELVSPAGEWDEEEHYLYESITRVGFGGRYEEALAIAAGPAARADVADVTRSSCGCGGRLSQPSALCEPAAHRAHAGRGRVVERVPREQPRDHGERVLAAREAGLGLLP